MRISDWSSDVCSSELYTGLNNAEFHFARYPAGHCYRKHMDQHRDQLNRKISLVLYLNREWSEAGHGELCLYSSPDENRLVQRVLPMPGRLVVFRSDLIPHEAMPCSQPRWRSEEHTSELQSLMRISYAVYRLKTKKINKEVHIILLHNTITTYINIRNSPRTTPTQNTNSLSNTISSHTTEKYLVKSDYIHIRSSITRHVM